MIESIVKNPIHHEYRINVNGAWVSRSDGTAMYPTVSLIKVPWYDKRVEVCPSPSIASDTAKEFGGVVYVTTIVIEPLQSVQNGC